ncbi:uncharacterized protein LOC103705685 [Phoenix dactylifera]|uniref:Uncharacterized protein LOC103705685 n=1 Tax=Phoenix dactylifera TaxID=42345 RepID=A0A8B7BY02_PHODC|nr:uncharacterized protein LOC103705685 [Phoenix dactylifera]XP_026660088.1 uncharacterized protein LOC103705685 [Phoenix dactylifera]XP_026660093.1 uncharacterized protein LOC103705685 [Phoenix dactylifera]
MHQVCGGGGEGKVACETLADGGGRPEAAATEDPTLPAESIRVRIGDEIDWTDLNVVYDRDDSTKGNTNPKAQHSSGKPPRSNSQRFSGNLKTKAPILGLPNKLQHSGYLGRSARRPANGRIFPKKKPPGGGGRKSAVPEEEPGSPKVSCFGKVLSERERERCRQQCRQSTAGAAEEREEKNSGCWASLAAVFRCSGGVERAATVESVEESSASPPSGGGPAKGRGLSPPDMAAPPPGLGGMRRFSSGRRPGSWSGDLDLEADGVGHVAWSGPLDREGTWARRSVGSLEDAERDRDWESEGSASV